MNATANRRLAAILAADVVGYNRLMGKDEDGTHRRVKALRTSIIEPLLTTHSGRLVKTTGDGFLIEFASVVSAFRYASDVQDALCASEQIDCPDALQLRIGINVGDVIADDDGDLFGDGVNIAARIEQICPPGGICVSERAWRDLRQQPVVFADLGPQVLKNIRDPIRAYAKMPGNSAGRRSNFGPVRLVGKRVFRHAKPAALIAAVMLVAILANFVWTRASAEMNTDVVTVAINAITTSEPSLKPLATSSSDALRGSFATVPNISIVQPDSGPNGRRDYAISADATVVGDRIRLTFKMVNARTGAQIIIHPIDRPVAERQVIPDQVAILARRLFGCILLAPALSETPIPDRALALYGTICADSLNSTLGEVRLLGFAREITAIAPDFGIGWSARGYYAASIARDRPGESRARLIKEAQSSIAKAAAINPDNSEIFLTRELLKPSKDIKTREKLLRSALDSTLAYGGYEYIQFGNFLSEAGRHAEAAQQFQAAYDLSPLDPWVGPFLIDALHKSGQPDRAAALQQALAAVWPGGLGA